MLPRGSVLRDGDLLRGDGEDAGIVVVVRAAAEALSVAETARSPSADPRGLPPGQSPRPAADRRRVVAPTSTTTCSTAWRASWAWRSRFAPSRSSPRPAGTGTTARATAPPRRPRTITTRTKARPRAPTTTTTTTTRTRTMATARTTTPTRSPPRPARAAEHREQLTMDSVGGVALTRLLHLASPALPIGAFAYSQGLEAAVAGGVVHDEAAARGAGSAACSTPRWPSRICRSSRACTRPATDGDHDAVDALERDVARLAAHVRAAGRGSPAGRVAGRACSAPRASTAARAVGARRDRRDHLRGGLRARPPRAFRFRRRAAATRFRVRLGRGADQRRHAPDPARPERRRSASVQLGARVPAVVDHASWSRTTTSAPRRPRTRCSAAHETQYSRLRS